MITKPGQRVQGTGIAGKVRFFPTAEGGIAAGWAFRDTEANGTSPAACASGVTNPVLVRGAVLAGVPIGEGWSEDPQAVLETGDRVRVDPGRKVVKLLRRRAAP